MKCLFFSPSKLIVKPLKISIGTQAQVRPSAAALEGEGVTSWLCHPTAAAAPSPGTFIPPQLREILVLES